MYRQILTRTPPVNPGGILSINEAMISLLTVKKTTNEKMSPSSSPIKNPLCEKRCGLGCGGFQATNCQLPSGTEALFDASQGTNCQLPCSVRVALDGSQVMRCQMLANVPHVTPITSALYKSARKIKTTTNENESASASPIKLPLREKIGGLAFEGGNSSKMTVKNPINPPITSACNVKLRSKALSSSFRIIVATSPSTEALTSPQIITNVNQRSGPFSRPSRSYARKSVPTIANTTLMMIRLSNAVSGRTVCANTTIAFSPSCVSSYANNPVFFS